MLVTTKISIDLQRPVLPAVINAVQGDQNTRRLEISLYSGGTAWPVPEGAEVAMRYRKFDKTKGYYDTMPDGSSAWSAQGNVITMLLAPQMLTVAGPVMAQLEMILNSSLLATFTMQINVAENPAAGVLQSEDYVNWLQWMKDELEVRMNEMLESGDFTGPPGPPPTMLSQITEYQASADYKKEPTGEWSSFVPDVAQGEYLWTRTTVTYNSGNPVVYYSVSRFGRDGRGSVVSVAGISPDADGNVPLTAEDVKALPLGGGMMGGGINMNGQKLSGLNAPTEDTEAATKGYTLGLVKMAAPLNLLDNSDFRNPVNQRGSYYETGKSSYPIDRWKYSYDGDTARGGAGYDPTNKYLYLINDSSNAGNTMLSHIIPEEKLKPGKYTIAVRQTGTNLSLSMLTYINGGVLKGETITPNANGISLMTFEITEVQTNLTIYIYAGPNQTLLFSWAALYEGEYTAETLPEYRPKGYGAELAECQRYYQIRSANNIAAVDMRPTMRLSSPTITSVTGGYAYSADL